MRSKTATVTSWTLWRLCGRRNVIYEVNGALDHLGGEVTELRDEARER